jgi:hypothetical protein
VRCEVVQWCCWRFKSSGVLYLIGCVFAEVVKYCSAFKVGGSIQRRSFEILGTAHPTTQGHMVQLIEAPRYKREGSQVQCPKVLLEFFIDIILLESLWPWG